MAQRRDPRPVRPLLAVVVAILLGLALPGTAAAHAGLVSTDPGAGSVVSVAPEEITLEYTEPVSVQPDGVRVLDSEAERVDLGNARADGPMVTVPVGDLPPGGYVVAWRVVSADSHPVAGAFTFSVGSAAEVGDDVVDGAFAGDDGRDQVIAGAMRAIVYVAALGLGGLAVVGIRLRRDGDPPPVPKVAGWVAAAGVLAAVAQVPIQASLITGRGWSSIAEAGTLRLALGDGIGWSLGLVILGLIAVGITAGLEPTRDVRRTATIGGALALAGLPLSGHTRTMDPVVVGLVADLAHVWAAAVWFGGLVSLIILIRHRRRRQDLAGAADAVVRFSGIAAVSVAIVAVAGIAMGWIEVGGTEGLTGSTYGRLLLAKVAVIAVVLLGARWNRSSFIPLIRSIADADADADADDDDPAGSDDADAAGTDGTVAEGPDRAAWRTFDGVLRFEVVGIAIAILITAGLVNVTPGKVGVGPQILSTKVELGDGMVDVVVDPAGVGANEVHVYVLGDDGRLDDRFEEVTVTLSLPSEDVPPIDTRVVEIATGHFQVVNVGIPLRGEWTLTITAKEDRFSEEVVEVTVPVR